MPSPKYQVINRSVMALLKLPGLLEHEVDVHIPSEGRPLSHDRRIFRFADQEVSHQVMVVYIQDGQQFCCTDLTILYSPMRICRPEGS